MVFVLDLLFKASSLKIYYQLYSVLLLLDVKLVFCIGRW